MAVTAADTAKRPTGHSRKVISRHNGAAAKRSGDGRRRIAAHLNLPFIATSTDWTTFTLFYACTPSLPPSLLPPLPAACLSPPVVWKNMFVFGEKSKAAAAAADITRPRGGGGGRQVVVAAAAPAAAHR